MWRNIKTPANIAPPATDEAIRTSALQFVRKLSGTNKPSKANARFNTRSQFPQMERPAFAAGSQN